MTDTLIAVYPDREHVDNARRELVRLHLAEAEAIWVDGPDDSRQSVRAEMEREVAESWASPGIGVFATKHMVRGVVLLALGLGAVGLVLGLPLGLLLFDVGDGTGVKLAVGAGIGGLFGATVGALLGGGFAVEHANVAPAAARGVTLRVDDPRDGAERLLANTGPIRVDRIVNGQPARTIATDEGGRVAETVHHLADNAADPSAR